MIFTTDSDGILRQKDLPYDGPTLAKDIRKGLMFLPLGEDGNQRLRALAHWLETHHI